MSRSPLWSRFAFCLTVVLLASACQQTPASRDTPLPSATTAAPTQTAHKATEPSPTVPTATPTRRVTPPPSATTGTPTQAMGESAQPSPTVPAATPTRAKQEATTSPVPPTSTPAFGYTHQRANGNRLVAGRGALPRAEPLDVPLDGVPSWVVAAPLNGESLWAVVLEDGRVQAYLVAGRTAEPVAIAPDRLPPGMPPLLRVENGVASLIALPSPAASPWTHPAALSGERVAYIEESGDLVLWDGREQARLTLAALPDARLLVDEQDRILLLGGATGRYGHGVLGDKLEASRVVLVETVGTAQIALDVPIPGDAVVEGLSPIWADLTGDGEREIILTISDAGQGAQVVVLNEAGERIGAGSAIGQGYRWRHQLVVAPFGPNGELELAVVLTPHIGGIVEFHRLEGETLRIVARVPGYTSHRIGSRNLDQALAGDLDGDGKIELVLPNQAMNELGGIRRTDAGAEVAWRVDVGGTVSTNLGAVTLDDGRLVLGVGHDGGILRLWLPDGISVTFWLRAVCIS